MADRIDEDFLADYEPGNPSPSGPDGDTPAPPAAEEFFPPTDADIPGEDEYPPDGDGAYDNIERRDYTGAEHRDYPIEEYGSYESHYPEHAAQMRAHHSARRQDAEHLSQAGLAGLQARVVDTLRSCLAAMQDRNGGELIELTTNMLASTEVIAYLEADMLQTYERLAEVFISEYAEDRSRGVDLRDLPGMAATSGRVQGELSLIQTRIGRDSLPTTPSATWKALVTYVQRVACRQAMMDLIAALDAGETDEKCMERFRKLPPPSANRALQNSVFSRSAKEWEEADIAAAAESPGFRLSSGYPTFDYAFTQQDGSGKDIEPRGAFAPGEVHIFAAPTGNGKSAGGRILIRNVLEDLVNGWRRKHDKVLIAITEESPTIVYTVAGMGRGQPFHHLADNLVIANVGASRRRFIHAIWDCVIDAYHRSQDTGVPIANCGLPSFVVLDYVGGLQEDGESADTTAIEKTSKLMMRGIAAWDCAMQEEFSGESFAAYAGMSWPTGMENFKPAVLGFAQFKKLADPLWYDSSAKNASTEDFVIPNADGEPGWEVLPGDFRIPTQGEVRGSGALINDATSLVIFHRSRPQKNPAIIDKETGKKRLTDNRARWLLIKTRNGANLPFIEMEFDSISSGLRGQFFDKRAEIALARGLIKPTECYKEKGDPILPHRPVRTPFDGIAY